MDGSGHRKADPCRAGGHDGGPGMAESGIPDPPAPSRVTSGNYLPLAFASCLGPGSALCSCLHSTCWGKAPAAAGMSERQTAAGTISIPNRFAPVWAGEPLNPPTAHQTGSSIVRRLRLIRSLRSQPRGQRQEDPASERRGSLPVPAGSGRCGGGSAGPAATAWMLPGRQRQPRQEENVVPRAPMTAASSEPAMGSVGLTGTQAQPAGRQGPPTFRISITGWGGEGRRSFVFLSAAKSLASLRLPTSPLPSRKTPAHSPSSPRAQTQGGSSAPVVQLPEVALHNWASLPPPLPSRTRGPHR